MSSFDDEFALTELIADSIREDPEMAPLREYLDECLLWGFRDYIAKAVSPLLPLVDAIVITHAATPREVEQLYGGDLLALTSALKSLTTLIAGWQSSATEERDAFSEFERFISPEIPLYRHSLDAFKGAIAFHSRAAERRLLARSSRSNQGIAENTVRVATWIRRHPWLGMLALAFAATAVAIAILVTLAKRPPASTTSLINESTPPESGTASTPVETKSNMDLPNSHVDMGPKTSPLLPSSSAPEVGGPSIRNDQSPPQPRLQEAPTAVQRFVEPTPIRPTDSLVVIEVKPPEEIRSGISPIFGLEPCGLISLDYWVFYPEAIPVDGFVNAARGQFPDRKITTIVAGVDIDPIAIANPKSFERSCGKFFIRQPADPSKLVTGYDHYDLPSPPGSLMYEIRLLGPGFSERLRRLRTFPNLEVCGWVPSGVTSMASLTIRVPQYAYVLAEEVQPDYRPSDEVFKRAEISGLARATIPEVARKRGRQLRECISADAFFNGPGAIYWNNRESSKRLSPP
jgi:hypothetical protein